MPELWEGKGGISHPGSPASGQHDTCAGNQRLGKRSLWGNGVGEGQTERKRRGTSTGREREWVAQDSWKQPQVLEDAELSCYPISQKRRADPEPWPTLCPDNLMWAAWSLGGQSNSLHGGSETLPWKWCILKEMYKYYLSIREMGKRYNQNINQRQLGKHLQRNCLINWQCSAWINENRYYA